jgi:hypothetical protein
MGFAADGALIACDIHNGMVRRCTRVASRETPGGWLLDVRTIARVPLVLYAWQSPDLQSLYAASVTLSDEDLTGKTVAVWTVDMATGSATQQLAESVRGVRIVPDPPGAGAGALFCFNRRLEFRPLNNSGALVLFTPDDEEDWLRDCAVAPAADGCSVYVVIGGDDSTSGRLVRWRVPLNSSDSAAVLCSVDRLRAVNAV